MNNIFYKTAIASITFLSAFFLMIDNSSEKNDVQIIEFKKEMLILPPMQRITFEDAILIKPNKD